MPDGRNGIGGKGSLIAVRMCDKKQSDISNLRHAGGMRTPSAN